MEYIKLKNSDLKVSRLCVGGCPMGGHGWGKVKEENLIETVKVALQEGVNFFDNADTYGLGKSEELLGKALGSNRHEAVIGTKFGVRVENGRTFYDNSPEWIRQALENSLKRLNTDYVDLYQIHYRDGITPIGDVIETLEKLKDKGYIRYIGLSNIHEEDVKELEKYNNKFVSFQNEYSLACRRNEKEMFDISKRLEVTPLTWGSLGQGILTGKYDKNVTFEANDRRSRDIYVNFHGEKLIKNLKIVEELKKISNEIDKPVSAVAIRWILDYLSDSVVIAGVKNINQLNGNREALGWNLSEEHIKILEMISKE